MLTRPHGQGALGEEYGEPYPNLSDKARNYLDSLRAAMPATVATLPDDVLFYHALAVLHAPAYRAANAGALRQDWPRILLPADAERLRASADLGRQIAVLLDTEQTAPGVTQGTIRPELRSIAVIARVGGGTLDPNAGELAVTANWGYAGQGGVTMPARGKAESRPYTSDEEAAIGERLYALGTETFDVYLNQTAYWRNVPARVWHYTLGGYQVMKKWLSYREQPLLGRALTVEEVREVTGMARRIAALLLLEPLLDANYEAACQA